MNPSSKISLAELKSMPTLINELNLLMQDARSVIPLSVTANVCTVSEQSLRSNCYKFGIFFNKIDSFLNSESSIAFLNNEASRVNDLWSLNLC